MTHVENVSTRLLTAVQALFGGQVQMVQMSVQHRWPSGPETTGCPCPSTTTVAEVLAHDHVVRLHPRECAPNPCLPHTAVVAQVDIDSLGLAYDAATLAVRLLGRGWCSAPGPVTLLCPSPEDRPARATNQQLDQIRPYVESLLALPVTRRIAVTRTLFAVLTQPGTQMQLATMLHISASTLRAHLSSIAASLPHPLDPRHTLALSSTLPTLASLWRREARTGRVPGQRESGNGPHRRGSGS